MRRLAASRQWRRHRPTVAPGEPPSSRDGGPKKEGKFGINTFKHAKQCVPHCVKYVLPKHEGKNLLHVAGQVGHCLLWECLPQAFRNAGKPGPFVADAMDVFQAQMESNAREKAEKKRVEEEAARLKAINRIEEAELASMEVELERAEHSEHVAWAVACVCALVAAGLAVLQNQRKERKARKALLAGPQGLA